MTRKRVDSWSIVHIITQLELGGAQLATFSQVANSQLPWQTRHLLFGPGGLLGDEAKQLEGVETKELLHLRRPISPINDLRALIEIVFELKAIARQTQGRLVVHTHSSKGGILGRLGAKLAGADIILHSIHGFGHCHQSSSILRNILWAAEKFASLFTDGFTADSQANIVQGIEEGLIGKEPARVVYCPVDRSFFSVRDPEPVGCTRLRENLGISRASKVVLNVSCLKPQKDLSTYLRVAQRVLKTEPEVVFLLAGDGTLRECLEEEAKALGIADSMRFLGWRRDIPELLSLSDVFVLTSLWEGLPQSFGQAMASGVPIVATRVDGAPEAIVHGVNGFLFAPKDVGALAHGVLKLVQDSSMRELMGKNGKDRAKKFSLENTISNLDEFYRAFVH